MITKNSAQFLTKIFFGFGVLLLAFFAFSPLRASAADVWSPRTGVINPVGISNLYPVVWSPELGIYVAFPNGGMVMTSTDGLTWTGRTSAESNLWDAAVWSPSLHIFVAVAESGTNRVMTSPDGIVWTAHAASAANKWDAIAWSPDLNLFVATSYGCASNCVMTSPDGSNWTNRTAAENNNWNSIVWSHEQSIFVAVAYTGTHRVMTSTNGFDWFPQVEAEANQWFGVTWSSDLGLFVAVASTGTHRVMTSINGTSWATADAAAANGWYSITWSHELGLFVATGTSGTNSRVMTSTNGTNWTIRTTPGDAANRWLSVAWSPTLYLFVAAGYSDGIMVSPDGINWFLQTPLGNGSGGNAIAWSPNLGLFVAPGVGSVMVSPDGSNWTRYTAPSGTWESVVWAPSLGLFAAVSFQGNIMTSANGTNWTQQTTPEANQWFSVAWAPSLGRFVAVSNNGTHRVITSTDGISWTFAGISGVPSIVWNAVTWSPDLGGLFVAVGAGGAPTSEVMTSPDGLTWSAQTAASGSQWVSVVWSHELSLFVAISNNGAGNNVMTSSDGVSWFLQSAASDSHWNSVTWSPALGEFKAVSSSGVGNRIMSSTNGTLWTTETSPFDNSWNGVTWAPSLGIFAAAGSSGGYGAIMVAGPGALYNVVATPAPSSVTITWSTAAASTSQIQYGTTSAYGTSTTLDASLVTSHSVTFSGLTSCQTYHFQAYSTQNSVTLNSGDLTFVTTGTCPPTVINPTVSAVTNFSANFSSKITVTGGVDSTVVGFHYGPTLSYGSTVSSTGTFSNITFSLAALDLACATLYHVQAFATNTRGTSVSSLDITFTTGACAAPSVISTAASSITPTSATLNGEITGTGGANASVRGFNYGPDASYGTTTTESGSFGAGVFTKALSGLTCSTVYHFASYATNPTGTAASTPDLFFTTLACPVASARGANIPITSKATGLGGAPLDFTINGGAQTASSPNLSLAFNGDPLTVKGFAVSLDKNFSGGGIIPYLSTRGAFLLPASAGMYTVYLKYYSTSGAPSDVIAHSVSYVPGGSAASPEAGTGALFDHTLKIGTRESEVVLLQKFLNAQGFTVMLSGGGSPGYETNFYGPATTKALVRFQEAHAAEILAPLGLLHGTGNFGSATLAFANNLIASGK